MDNLLRKAENIPWNQVKITGGFWKEKIEINQNTTLKAEYKQCKDTGRMDSIKCLYDVKKDNRPQNGVFTIDGVFTDNLAEGGIPRPHHYWDSDIAKWMEAAAYGLANYPDPKTEEIIDAIIDDFEALQQKDGYLNTYFTVVEPGKRWTNVYRMHELYCAGHLIEAAIAYYQVTNKKKFLDIVCRYADHIDTVFGAEEYKIHGYPGHQEIELALVKLYKVTNREKYLRLAEYFLNERGQQPHFFEEEAKKQGRDTEDGGPKGILGRSYLDKGPYALFQAHLPIRQQKSAEGHAVRVTYMGCGIADVASEVGDTELWDAGKALWDSVTLKKMYITGGIGAQDGSERFSFDYQLPNESSYNETCASVGLVMWASRMLQTSQENVYGDIMEKALYNGVISGVSLKGDRFFYANHLASHPQVYEDNVVRNPRMFPKRQSWFPVSCCPMNLARLINSVAGYAYAVKERTVFMHLYMESTVQFKLENNIIKLEQKTCYPWKDTIEVKVLPEMEQEFEIAFRIPEWCKKAQVSINDETIEKELRMEAGYTYIKRIWKKGEILKISLPMKPYFIQANPSVREDCGKVAIQCGPIIYCLEEEDNGKDMFDFFLSKESHPEICCDKELLGGVNYIKMNAKRRQKKNWENKLYGDCEETFESIEIKAIPYYLWSNRGEGEMTVWINYR